MTLRRTQPAGLGLGLALLMGGAACSEGCARELPATQAADKEPIELDALQHLLWPEGPAPYKLMAEAELAALERLITLLWSRAPNGMLMPGQARRAARDADIAGVELHDLQLAHEGKVEQFWVVAESTADRRGRGAYVFRLGPLRGSEGRSRTEILLQAPHTRFDTHTGEIAVGMFIESELEARPARALMLNSAHRHAQLDGTRDKREPASQNPADAAHREDHPFARVSDRLVHDHAVAIVQLHGFGRDEAAGEPDVIVSAGRKQPRAASLGVAERLRPVLGEFEVRHYGDGIDRLGGRTNVQGRATRDAGRCFVHIETSARVRGKLREDRALRSRFAAAILGGSARELRGGCR